MSDSADLFAPPRAPTLESSPPRAPVASRSSRLGATRIDGVFGVLCWFIALQLVKGVANVTSQPGESLGNLLARPGACATSRRQLRPAARSDWPRKSRPLDVKGS